MVELHIEQDALQVRIRGIDALWALKRSFVVPLAAIKSVRLQSDLSPWLGFRGNELGLRLPGTMLPGQTAAGSYRRDGQWTFCCLHRGHQALVIDLDPATAPYRRLVLGFRAPPAAQAALAMVEQALIP